jgi:SnoaL-like protein
MESSPITEVPDAGALEASALGRRFAEALGRKDFDAILGLMDPEIDFRGLTPGRAWEASGASGVGKVLRQWFEEDDDLEELLGVETDAFADRIRVAYSFRGRNPGIGPFVVEQQAYYTERDGRINWMRVLCSGFRATE